MTAPTAILAVAICVAAAPGLRAQQVPQRWAETEVSILRAPPDLRSLCTALGDPAVVETLRRLTRKFTLWRTATRTVEESSSSRPAGC